MRAKEFILEATPGGKMHHHMDNANQGATRLRDVGGYDRTYHLNRMMMAAACHDGKDANPIKDMDSGSWVEKYNTAHSYTKEEDNMIMGAMKTIGAESHHPVSDHRSTEHPDTHKTSPVTGFKGYKRR
jgi:hypothetical protein